MPVLWPSLVRVRFMDVSSPLLSVTTLCRTVGKVWHRLAALPCMACQSVHMRLMKWQEPMFACSRPFSGCDVSCSAAVGERDSFVAGVDSQDKWSLAGDGIHHLSLHCPMVFMHHFPPARHYQALLCAPPAVLQCSHSPVLHTYLLRWYHVDKLHI